MPVISIQGIFTEPKAAADSPRGRLALELRSVNARFLDLQFRVAEELRAIMAELGGAELVGRAEALPEGVFAPLGY